MQYLIETSDTEETEQCFDQIKLDECSSYFKCKPGYSFLPSSEYLKESELRIVTCEGKGEIEDICEPVYSFEECTKDTNINDYQCRFSSNSVIPDKLPSLTCRPPTQSASTTDPPQCLGVSGRPDEEPGMRSCVYNQIEKHYPVWNGQCVPVSCNVTDEVKEIYKLSYDTCSSENRNCGLSNVTCSDEKYNVSNTERMIYCRAPRKVDSTYSTTDYELVNIGCSKNPPELSDAEKAKLSRGREFSESGDSIIGTDDRTTAEERDTGITEENIGESANFRGTLDDETLELEVGLEEGRQSREQQLEERSAQDSDVGARALASGMTQAEINTLER